MAERRPQATDDGLEQRLSALGGALDLPATPDLAGAAGTRLRAPRVRGLLQMPLLRSAAWRWAMAASLLLLLGGSAVLASPGGRDALAERLGLRGVKITYVATVPAVVTEPPGQTPAPLGNTLALGRSVSTAEAQRSVAFAVLGPEPDRFGTPDAVYLGAPPPGGQVSLVYRAREGLPPAETIGIGMLFTQFRGSVDTPFVEKLLAAGTRLERVSVGGRPGYWIEGRAHAFLYRDANGQPRDERIRLAGNTLLWEQDGLTLRLESALSRDEALRVAESIVPIAKK
jgi:hypothetical protein